MLTKSLPFLFSICLTLTSLNAQSNSAENVAIQSCEATKVMDFQKLKSYTIDTKHAELDMIIGQLDAAKAQIKKMPEQQRLMAEQKMQAQLDMMKKIDCQHMTMKKGEEGTMIAVLSNHPEMGSTTLQKIKGQWKIIK